MQKVTWNGQFGYCQTYLDSEQILKSISQHANLTEAGFFNSSGDTYYSRLLAEITGLKPGNQVYV